MIHPTVRLTDIQGWIPRTDADGVDIRKQFAAFTKNADFENGFVRGCIAPSKSSLPEEVTDIVEDGFILIDVVYFRHSIRGGVWVYILWRINNTLRVVIKDDFDIVVKNLGNMNLPIMPTNISYNVVDDQLKINLNVTVTNTIIDKDVVLNLTVIYFPENRVYKTGAVELAAGWFVSLRWLDWGYEDIEDKTTVYFEADTSGASYQPNFNPLDSNITLSGITAPGGGVASVSAGNTGTITITGLSNVGSIGFQGTGSGGAGKIKVEVTDMGTLTILHSSELSYDNEIRTDNIYVFGVGNPVEVKFTLMGGTGGIVLQSTIIQNLYAARPDAIFLKRRVVVLAKHIDGQRTLVYSSEDSVVVGNDFGVFNDLELFVEKDRIDWRVTAYEIYAILSSPSIYVLAATIPVEDGWVVSGSYVKHSVELKETTQSLNFNYGLGATVKVGNQKEIYDEIAYKGRVYFGKNDHRIYQSHISGTGRIQPDSFPYDEETEFGYFITSNEEKNLVLSVTNLDELHIIGERQNYTYYIEGGQGIVYRTLKSRNGEQSILSRKSISKSLSGAPTSVVQLWADKYGIYVYPGGRNAPQDIAILTHRNYWKQLAGKENTVIFFNKAKTEFWIAVGNEILVYELPFNKFKRYEFDFVIKSYIETVDDVLYFLSTDGEIWSWNPEGTTRMAYTIESHYSIDTVAVDRYPIDAPEHETKILQELFVCVKEKIPGIIKMTIIADDNNYPEITFTSNMLTDLLPAPLLIRYGKVRFRLFMAAGSIQLREFGYSFSVPGQSPYQQAKKAIQGIGMSSGTSAGIGL